MKLFVRFFKNFKDFKKWQIFINNVSDRRGL
jgi:hypothetical protein